MSIIDRARALRLIIEQLSSHLTDLEALDAVEIFPHWSGDGVEYIPNESRVSYNGVLYKCIGSASHISQPSWAPDITPSLWVRVDNPAEEWPEWVRPTGSEDGYEYGRKVSHNGKHWISNYNGVNVWEPGVFGWDEVS